MVCNGVLPIDQLREYTGPSRNLRPRKCDGTAKTSLPAASPAKPKAAPVKKSPAKSGPVKKATPKKATTKKKTVPKKTTTQPYKAVAPKDPPESEAARIERLKWKVWPPYIDVWEIPKCHQQHYADLFKTRGNPVPAWKRGCTQDHKDPVQARRLISWRAVYVVDWNEGEGKYHAVCVKPEGESMHNGGKPVWFERQKNKNDDLPRGDKLRVEFEH